MEIVDPPDSGFDSRNASRRTTRWLGDQRQAVIHVNCGLHDVKKQYDNEPAQRVSLVEHRQNLQDIVPILQQRADHVVWAPTTPALGDVRDKSARTNAAIEAYDASASEVMASLGVPINDLHAAIGEAGPQKCISDDGVHISEHRYRVLGHHVTTTIRKTIEADTK